MNLLEHLLGQIFPGTNSETCCSRGNSSFSDPAPPCPAHNFNRDHKAVKGYWGRLVLSLNLLSWMFMNEYKNTEIHLIKPLASQKKPFLHPTCYTVTWIKLQKPCTNSSSGGRRDHSWATLRKFLASAGTRVHLWQTSVCSCRRSSQVHICSPDTQHPTPACPSNKAWPGFHI